MRTVGNLGNAYLEQDRFEEARWCYERARVLEPSLSLKAYGNMGNVYIEMKEYSRAMGLFSRILSINADDELSYVEGPVRSETVCYRTGGLRSCKSREPFDGPVLSVPGRSVPGVGYAGAGAHG